MSKLFSVRNNISSFIKRMNFFKYFGVFLCSSFGFTIALSPLVFAQDDEVISIETTVTGNQEQPKVLYIVPWKEATDTTILSLPITTKLDDVFDHVDRAEHQRHVRFVESLSGVDED